MTTDPSPSAVQVPPGALLQGPDRPDLLRGEILAELFEATARRIPHKTALEFGEHRLSYGELNAAADRVAHHLIEQGVRPGRIVGLWLPRGMQLLIAQLAIAKTGAAWLPFDQLTPVDRIQVCLEDADAVALLTSDDYLPRLAEHTGTPLTCPQLSTETLLSSAPAGPLRHREGAGPEHTAYVIYTSGSTGKPKGIAISQGSIAHFLRSENVRLGIHEGDRVYQGFSVAFDMSFEEIWISYLVGATLWLAPPEITGDPEALVAALTAQRITVLHAVPTLLALFAQDVPTLRLINLGGEMCPQALVDKWAVAPRQVFNTYGPTEATVSASLAELHAGEPVTIGEPLPNYGMLVIQVIDSDSIVDGKLPPLKLLPPGEIGELCIYGPGVAEGYLGRPDLTAEKFLPNPWATQPQDARLYRSGDLARIDEQGQMQCLGRADDQIKIRGFRVELGEIEAVLAAQPGVGTTAVVLRKDDDVDQLIGFVVRSDDGPQDAGPAAWRAALAAKLPPYMVPARFEVLDAMPRLPSGKIDRKPLRSMPLAAPEPSAAGAGDDPQTPAEQLLFPTLAKLFPGQAIVRGADFFDDLGGHSLMAARLVSALRTQPGLASATVRDIYQHRRVGRIAEALQLAIDAAGAQTAAERAPREFVLHSTWRRWRCGVAQAVVTPLLVALKMAQWLAPFFAYHFFTGADDDSIPRAVAVSVAAFLLATLFGFFVAWAGKWLVAGRLKPGRHPLWGLTYFRWWLSDRLIESVPAYMLAGSSLQVRWLRALGARIGKDVSISTVVVRAPDLLTVDDGATLGNAVSLQNARVEGGMLILGPIHVGRDANVGSYTVLQSDSAVGDDAQLDGQSSLRSGQAVPAGRSWAGSPAADQGLFEPERPPARPPKPAGWGAWETFVSLAGSLVVAVLFFLPVFPTFMLIDVLDIDRLAVQPLLDAGSISDWQAFGLRLLKFFVLALPASAVLIAATVLVAAGLRWGLLPRVKPGRFPLASNKYLSKWIVNQIQEASLAVLHGLYATVYSPIWYRLLGAKVGKEAELSTALGLIPDMLTLGDETFVADAVMLGDEQIDRGWVTMQPTVVERRSFLGNGSYVPDGSVIPSGVLIGVMSAVPRGGVTMKDGDTWLGSPPMHLPAREVVSGFPESLTFAPSWRRRIARGLVEAFRIAAPHALVIAAGYAIVLDAMPLAEAGRWRAVALDLTLAGIMFGLATFLFVALFKWVFIRRYRKAAVPMWTPFVWASEAVTNMYEGIAVPNFLNLLRGTPMLPIALNLLGTRIHPTAWIDTTDLTEFDAVKIGAHSELNAMVCPQTHLFEDRVMKIDEVVIGDRVTIGARCTVLYGAKVGDDVQLGPMTLVMKGENLPDGTRWHGIPAAPMRG